MHIYASADILAHGRINPVSGYRWLYLSFSRKPDRRLGASASRLIRRGVNGHIHLIWVSPVLCAGHHDAWLLLHFPSSPCWPVKCQRYGSEACRKCCFGVPSGHDATAVASATLEFKVRTTAPDWSVSRSW